tara:strand:+ start:6979 stop:8220 length:1242 start_codon:yes stop_codon:yes gene_type:complete
MKNHQEFQIFELSNGLKVVHKEVNRPVAHCGLMINAGTRDELAGEHGIAHFIEHAIFKGTKKRRAYHILNRLDSVGGDLDAYTTKEQTCIYASFLSEYYERAIELLSDLVQHSQFPEKELEKEKEVVLDEIKVYQDSPSDQIYDDFESQVFENHALGNAILGSPESVNALTREKILAYMKRMYTIENMIFTSVGKISAKRLKLKLEKHFADLSSSESANNRGPFQLNSPKVIHEKKGSFQTHCMMGKATYGANNPQRIGMSLLNNILGGPAMNSILNLKVREKYGFTYNIESNYAIYSDVGLFSIYLGTDPKYIERCQTAIFKELKNLRNKPLSSNKLHLAKQQLKGQMALGRESNSNLMLSYGKSLLTKGYIRSMEEIQQTVDLITANELLEIAQEEFLPENFDLLFFDGKV